MILLSNRSIVFLMAVMISAIGLAGCSLTQQQPTPAGEAVVVPSALPAPASEEIASPSQAGSGTPAELEAPTSSSEGTASPLPAGTGHSRGYLTTPQELAIISQKAEAGLEPYRSAMADTLIWADKDWDYNLDADEACDDANDPAWIDDNEGIPVVYAKALAYHLTGKERYAEEVKQILEQIMTEVETISLEQQACRLNFSWGTPELVAAADLIEAYWYEQTCTGPTSTLYTDTSLGSGNCKALFQNWLVKNPYYVTSYSAIQATSNWGAAATNATAYIADYLWDRPEVRLIHRNPPQINEGKDSSFTPAEAYAHANRLALDRMNGYGVEYASNDSCDYLGGKQQHGQWAPVKSQITEKGIIPEDARREEFCNISQYNGEYQNYPQIHLSNNIQQCELMLRRGDRTCFDNVDNTDIPDYSFVDPNGVTQVTHLYPGRGSIERGIKAVIVDSATEWRHDSGLEVAYRYYYNYHTLPGFEHWFQQLNRPASCSQDVCFGTLTHGFAPGEEPELPPVVPLPETAELNRDLSLDGTSVVSTTSSK